MEENKNTFFYKSNIVIEKERESITPEPYDEFFLCKDWTEVYERAVRECTGEHITESYSSESFDEHVTGYKLCHRLSINGNMYKFFGYKMIYPNGLSKRRFYLYETD